MNQVIRINKINKEGIINEPFYHILLINGTAAFSVNLNRYECPGKSMLFLSPYQLLEWHSIGNADIEALSFHGDFYCIEFHKQEVACNGILFNNIYERPFVSIPEGVFGDIRSIIEKMKGFAQSTSAYDESIVKTYLQLILALCSKEKQIQMAAEKETNTLNESILSFQKLLDEHFLQSREISFYADKFGLSADSFSKKIKKHFGKTPSQLIGERIILEAKKLLHLTYMPIKEIAAGLHFEDEFYFSRYFKKAVGISPKKFREDVGISIVAKLSM